MAFVERNGKAPWATVLGIHSMAVHTLDCSLTTFLTKGTPCRACAPNVRLSGL